MSDHASLADVLAALSPVVTAALGLVVALVVRSPKEHERAAHIAQVATDIAALVVAEKPGTPYSMVSEWVVQRLKEAGLTSNEQVVRQAAAGALAGMGVKP